MLYLYIAAINGEEEMDSEDEDAELDNTPPPSPPAEHRDIKKTPSSNSSTSVHNHVEKVCVCVYVCVCVHVYVCARVCVCVCAHICMYALYVSKKFFKSKYMIIGLEYCVNTKTTKIPIWFISHLPTANNHNNDSV